MGRPSTTFSMQVVPGVVPLFLNVASDVRTGRSIVKAVLDYYQFLGLVPYQHSSALPLHDLPRGRGPGSPPLHARQSRTHLPLHQVGWLRYTTPGMITPHSRLGCPAGYLQHVPHMSNYRHDILSMFHRCPTVTMIFKGQTSI